MDSGSGDEIVYLVAAVSVKMDVARKSQKFHMEHNDDILSIAVDGQVREGMQVRIELS